MQFQPRKDFCFVLIFLCLFCNFVGASFGATGGARSQSSPLISTCTTLVVPTQYRTIQKAINAAKSCDTVQLLPGIYQQQITINKSITILGNSSSNTFIQAPSMLGSDSEGLAGIIEIAHSAKVTIEGVNVTGPGPSMGNGPCLLFGIYARASSELTLEASDVSQIRDNPVGSCINESGNDIGAAIIIGDFVTSGTAKATIVNDMITDFQNHGILVENLGSDALIAGNTITGIARAFPQALVFSHGIRIYGGASATIEYNTISEIMCTFECGSNIQSQTQGAGILVEPGIISQGIDSRVVVEYNYLYNNFVGIYIAHPSLNVLLSHNTLINNTVFGIEVQDSNNTFSHNLVVGGEVGAVVGADSINSTLTLSGNQFLNQTVSLSETQSENGYYATIIQT